MEKYRGVRHFARCMLMGDRLQLSRGLAAMRASGVASEAILFRDRCWQVELAVIPPNGIVPKHRHHRVDTCEVGIAGSGTLQIGGRSMEIRQRGPVVANMRMIPAGVWHGGSVGPDGAMFLSFQKWASQPVGFITEDWEAWSPTAP